MGTKSTISESAEAISKEIALNLSYLTDEKDRRFDPITVATGASMILLGWFFEGVRDALREQVRDAGKNLASHLATRLRKLFSSNEGISEAKVFAAADAARSSATRDSPDDLVRALDVNERAIADYFKGEGMPESDARRIAKRVREEASRHIAPLKVPGHARQQRRPPAGKSQRKSR